MERHDELLARIFDEHPRALIVVAHPGDEALCAGGHLDQLHPTSIAHLAEQWPDLRAAASLVAAVRFVEELIEELAPEVVLTLAYDGAHPDHDAASFAVQAACALARRHGIDPAAIEMSPEPFPPGKTVEIDVQLDESQSERKREMLARSEVRGEIPDRFDPDVERFRLAPAYDFERPPFREARAALGLMSEELSRSAAR